MTNAWHVFKWLRAYFYLEPGDEVVWWAVTKHYAWLASVPALWFLMKVAFRLGAPRLWR